MKKEIFDQYLEAILNQFKIDRSKMVSNSRKKDHVEARQMLYYLCHKRNMRLNQIQKFMEEEGYLPNHCQVHRGIKASSKLIEEDMDFRTVMERIENSVFI